MAQVVTATFADGVLKPAQQLHLPSGTKVRLIVDAWDDVCKDHREVTEELERLCNEFPIQSRGERLTRDDLHDRH